MAYEILSESYGRRLPKIAAEADSADDLATLGTNWAEGSTCVIGDKTYSLDKVQGWVEPGSGGGALPAVTSDDNGDVLTVVDGVWGKAAPSGGGVIIIQEGENHTLPLTWQQIYDGLAQGVVYNLLYSYSDTGTGEYGVGMNQVYSADYLPTGAGDQPIYMVATSQFTYEAQSADDYPSLAD